MAAFSLWFVFLASYGPMSLLFMVASEIITSNLTSSNNTDIYIYIYIYIYTGAGHIIRISSKS